MNPIRMASILTCAVLTSLTALAFDFPPASSGSVSPSTAVAGAPIEITVAGGVFNAGDRLSLINAGPTLLNYADTVDSVIRMASNGDDKLFAVTRDYEKVISFVGVDGANPTVAGDFGPTNEFDIWDLAIDGNYLYAGVWSSEDDWLGLAIFDVSDPSNIKLLSTAKTDWVTSRTGLDVLYSNGYAYLLMFDSVFVVDVNNPTAPFVATRLEFPVTAGDDYFYYGAITGSYLNVSVLDNDDPVDGCNSTGSYHLVDIANPSTPILVTSVTGECANRIAASGNRVYFSHPGGGVSVLDISSPLTGIPEKSLGFDFPTEKIAAGSSVLAVVNTNSEMVLFDVTHPEDVRVITHNPMGPIQTVMISNDKLFCVSGHPFASTWVPYTFDISAVNGSNMSRYLAGSGNGPMAVADGMLYTASLDNAIPGPYSIKAYKASPTSSPAAIGTTSVFMDNILYWIAPAGTNLFLRSSDFSMLDFTDASTPVFFPIADAGQNPPTLLNDYQADYIYAGGFSQTGVYDLSMPLAPQLLNSLDVFNFRVNKDVAEGIGITTAINRELVFFDTSDPSNPVESGRYALPNVAAAVISGSTVFAAVRNTNSTSGVIFNIVALDVTNPANAALLWSVPFQQNHSILNMVLAADRLLVLAEDSADGVQRVFAYDVNDDTILKLVQVYEPGQTSGIVSGGDSFFVSDPDLGVGQIVPEPLLKNVQYINSSTMKATVPADMPPGRYTLLVTDVSGTQRAYKNAITLERNHSIQFRWGPEVSGTQLRRADAPTVGVKAIDYTHPTLQYLWSSQCSTAAINGAFVDPFVATTSWIAPPNPSKNYIDCVLSIGVTDGDGGLSKSASTTVKLMPNSDPVASAGPDYTIDDAVPLPLNACGTVDADGDPLQYKWTQLSGPALTIPDINSCEISTSPAYVNAPEEVATFRLDVTDEFGYSSSDDLTVTIIDINHPPTFLLTPEVNAKANSLVRLTATHISDLDPEHTVFTYTWEQTSGMPVQFVGGTTPSLSFLTPDLAGGVNKLGLKLTVADSDGAASSADVTVLVSPNTNGFDSGSSGGGGCFLQELSAGR